MTTTASAFEPSFEGLLADVVWRRSSASRPVASLSRAECAARLMHLQQERARTAAAESDLIVRMAQLTPDDADPAEGKPGARSRTWRLTEPEFPGISEAFPHELALVLGVGHGTAAHKLRRAWTLRHRLPLTEAAQRRAELDERRVQIMADTLACARPDLAGRAESVVLPEAAGLSFTALKRRIHEVLLELDPGWADENRTLAEKNADVFLEPGADGRATLGAELDATEAAEGRDFINTLAVMRKEDGDPRPIGQIRTEVYSLLVRGAAIGAAGARSTLTIVAALETLEGSSTRPGDVNGWAVTPTALADLLRRIGALGLQMPDDGELTFGITDDDGTLLATLSPAELEKAVRNGEGANPPPPTSAYTPTAKQRRFVKTRDRTCRWPFCGQQVGWADLDHVVSHRCGGETTCTNLCCLCRRHHRIKTHFAGWAFRMEPDGTLHVTTPSGVTRTTEPWALRRRPPPPPPESDLPPF